MKVPCLRLSADHSSFYVGYMFNGLVQKYSVDAGMLLCSALAHHGDVYTLAVVQPDVLCTSGSDGQVRLLEMNSNNSAAESSTLKPIASLSHDELAYKQMCNGVQSIRRVGPRSDSSTCCLLVCLSTLSAPQLVNIRDGLDVQSFNLSHNTDIGNYFLSTFI